MLKFEFEPFGKLGSLSLEPGAYLLQAKILAWASEPEPRFVPPLILIIVCFARPQTASKFAGIEQFWVCIFGPELRSVSWENGLQPHKPLIFYELFLSLVHPTASQAMSSLSKAHGLGHDLCSGSIGCLSFYCELFIGSGPSSRVGYPFLVNGIWPLN